MMVLTVHSSTDKLHGMQVMGLQILLGALIDKTTSMPNGAENVFIADIDGDGDLMSLLLLIMTTLLFGMRIKVLHKTMLLSIADVTTSNENAANATFTVNLSNASPRYNS